MTKKRLRKLLEQEEQVASSLRKMYDKGHKAYLEIVSELKQIRHHEERIAQEAEYKAKADKPLKTFQVTLVGIALPVTVKSHKWSRNPNTFDFIIRLESGNNNIVATYTTKQVVGVREINRETS